MTMVVQHLDNRLALSSVDPNEQLHEFQIVHALITQCRKQASADENARNNISQGCENQSPDTVRRKGSKEEKSSFVTTIRQTFNALAQATNPSLCAKQNVTSHPVSIASTVKNIISQFSRQAYHGSISLASPSSHSSAPKQNQPPRRDLSTRKKVPTNKGTSVAKKSTSQPRPLQTENSSAPSTSARPILECTPIKSAVIRQSNSTNLVATKPKTRSVRARNAHRLMRHESAPIPPPVEGQGAIKKSSASVRRSKSDAICYTSYARQRRNIESNVQTKVLHFENCCKGKGQASMCLECRKHNLEEGLPTPSLARSSPALPKTETIKPKPENYVGALSYHKPSIITQSQSALSEISSDDLSSVEALFENPRKKTPPPTAARPKAVVCAGGTFFLTTEISKPTVSAPTDPVGDISPNATKSEKTGNVVYSIPSNGACPNNIPQFSQMKRKHSDSEDEPMQNKKEIKENEQGNAIPSQSEASAELSNAAPISEVADASLQNLTSRTEIEHCDMDIQGASSVQTPPVACANQNLYSLLCSNSATGNSPESAVSLPEDSNIVEALQLPLDYDSSDNMDSSSSSSGESCVSPRQDYLARSKGWSTPIRRTPSSRYQRMRRKMKKLFTKSSRPSLEIVQPIVQTPSELEKNYLENLKIPTPNFMLRDSFSARRQQLAMHFDSQRQDTISRLPDHVLVQMFSYMDTRSLAMLKCVCQDFSFLIESYDIRGIDSLWVKDKRYLEDPCRFCRKRFTPGDVSMCQYHAKSYHCDLPYGRSYWMCCFKIERSAPGCRTGIHDNHWGPSSPSNSNKG